MLSLINTMETITLSSKVWYLCAEGILLTNDQVVAFTAQHAILEPFRDSTPH